MKPGVSAHRNASAQVAEGQRVRGAADLRRQALEFAREVQALDIAVYKAIADEPTPVLDVHLRRLSQAANRSVLWLSIAAALAVRPGRSRHAAGSGVASIGLASFGVNVVAKTLANRQRPLATDLSVATARHVPMPRSTSFPSGHSASGFAFASAVGSEMPGLSLPLHLLATAVAYSRVHAGVHYPLDTLVGASLGLTAGSAVAKARRRRP